MAGQFFCSRAFFIADSQAGSKRKKALTCSFTHIFSRKILLEIKDLAGEAPPAVSV
jgi:hypothetical protein